MPSISGTSMTLESPEKFKWFCHFRKIPTPLPESGQACQDPAQTVRHLSCTWLPASGQMADHSSPLSAEPQTQRPHGQAPQAPGSLLASQAQIAAVKFRLGIQQGAPETAPNGEHNSYKAERVLAPQTLWMEDHRILTMSLSSLLALE